MTTKRTAIRERFTNYIHNLQEKICKDLEEADGKAVFQEDRWSRAGGGGGVTRVIADGDLLEKGGVNISTVHGKLPEEIRDHFGVEQGWFFAAGLSLVLHPESPMIPTVHANVRLFELYEDPSREVVSDRWFGGGTDLTPYYLFEEDAVHFHTVLREMCDQHEEGLYPIFKKECDTYFYNSHREEARGVGGIFFDYLREAEGVSDEDWFRFVTDAGNHVLDSWLPIAKRRLNEPYGDAERYWQEIRRGRYVEFNLIHDRGTLFGLRTNGRVESILMSLPPRVRWDYDYQPEPDSREAALVERLKEPVEWVVD